MSNILTTNNLIQQPNQVYRLANREDQVFDYSDGESVEKYLFDTLSHASDLGSRSYELQDKIIDWPSEYHLTSDRSNVLRCFDLSFANNALEFGSGCGAISRYLGELGLEVDAVEGSPIRAELGKLRCKDLNNVNVINANYNDLVFPEQHYDLILFIGVIEYARKFHPEAESDYDAAVAILRHAKKLLSDNGVIIIAIENRLGLKYILGQHEDHYAKKFIGVDGYKQSAGIATYSENEWGEILDASGLNEKSFCYPFPDYKIPRVCLGEEYVKNDRHAYNHLEGVFARDYTRPVKKSPVESIAWQAANSGQFLNTIANSFSLVVGNNLQTVKQAADFDFCHMPGPGRKNQFAVTTRKKKQSETVAKTPLFSQTCQVNQANEAESKIFQNLEQQRYLKGDLLSTRWLRAILIYSRREEFDSLIDQYFQYLGELEPNNQLKIDLLPINIIVSEDESYTCFDQEWEVDWQITKEYLLFRALLTFIVTNWIHMKDFLGWMELHTVRDFIDYGFRNHKLQLASYLEEFIRLENHFQKTITNSNDERSVEGLLETRFDFTVDQREVYGRIFWLENNDEDFTLAQSVEIAYVPGPEYQTLEFNFPKGVENIKSIRLDPFDLRKTDKVGFFNVSDISLIGDSGEAQKCLWQLSGEQEIAAQSNGQSTWFEPLSETGAWLSSTDFPKLVFHLAQPLDLSEKLEYGITITLRVSESMEYILAHQRYLTKIRQTEQLENDFKNNLRHLSSARQELADIKAGRPFRLGMKIFSILSKFKP